MESSDVTGCYVSWYRKEKIGGKTTVVQDIKTLVPNVQLKFSIKRQILAKSSTSASEFLVGLGAYNGCFWRLLEMASQEGSSRHNDVKSTETN